MAFQYDEQVGTGQTYTTLASWESARNLSEAWTGDRRARMLAELFSEGITAAGGGDTGNTYRLYLEADSGAEHDGRSNTVSSAGNARFNGRSGIEQADVSVSWLELNYLLEFYTDWFDFSPASDGGCAHHCIVCSENPNADDCHGFVLEGDVDVYRNIIYWSEKPGVHCDNVNAKVLHNTGHRCGSSNSVRDGIYASGSNPVIENNAIFDVDVRGGENIGGSGTEDNNATSDGTGDSAAGLTNLITSDQITVASTIASTIDLTLKDTNADIYQAGSTTYSTTTYPEINVPITDRVATITGTWSVGADDIIPTSITLTATSLEIPIVFGSHSLTTDLQATSLEIPIVFGNHSLTTDLQATSLEIPIVFGSHSLTTDLQATSLEIPIVFGSAELTANLDATRLEIPIVFGNHSLTTDLQATSLEIPIVFGSAELTANLDATSLEIPIVFGNHSLTTDLQATSLEIPIVFGSHSLTADLQATSLEIPIVFGSHSLTANLDATSLEIPIVFGSAELTANLDATSLGIPIVFGSAELTANLDATSLEIPIIFGSHSLTVNLDATRLEIPIVFGSHSLTTDLQATSLETPIVFGSHSLAEGGLGFTPSDRAKLCDIHAWMLDIDGKNFQECMRIAMAVLAGESTVVNIGGNNYQVVYRAIDDSKDRVIADVVSQSRTSVTLDET